MYKIIRTALFATELPNSIKSRKCLSQASSSSCSFLLSPRLSPSQYTHGRLQQVQISAAPTTTSYTQQTPLSSKPGYHPCKHQALRLFDYGVSVLEYNSCTTLIVIAVSGSPGGGCDKGTSKASIPELEPVTLGVYDGQSLQSLLR